jgi:hypothetical protein
LFSQANEPTAHLSKMNSGLPTNGSNDLPPQTLNPACGGAPRRRASSGTGHEESATTPAVALHLSVNEPIATDQILERQAEWLPQCRQFAATAVCQTISCPGTTFG